MIHAVCDFCGRDVDRSAIFLSLTPFQNFARYYGDTEPFGYKAETKSFVICHDCAVKHGLPNPYMFDKSVLPEKVNYEFPLDSVDGEKMKCRIDTHDKNGEEK